MDGMQPLVREGSQRAPACPQDQAPRPPGCWLAWSIDNGMTRREEGWGLGADSSDTYASSVLPT